jgi:hypothetical protein
MNTRFVSDKSTILSFPFSITHLCEALSPAVLYNVTNDNTFQIEIYLRLKLKETHPTIGILMFHNTSLDFVNGRVEGQLKLCHVMFPPTNHF